MTDDQIWSDFLCELCSTKKGEPILFGIYFRNGIKTKDSSTLATLSCTLTELHHVLMVFDGK